MPGFLLGTILPQPHKRRLPLWVSLLGIALFCLLFVFLHVGQWLVVQDPLQRASAIAVLSGRMPDRALEAARVYKQGYANRVWLTHSKEPGATMAKLSVPYVGEEEYNRIILIHEGVPETAIQVLDPPIINTADEMRTIGQALRTEQLRIVILITSPVHTRRTKTLWNRISGKDGTAVLHAVSDDSYDAAHWWRTTRDALDVVREVLGLANAWAGLPLQPSHE
jgi:uncharacterized SAM-binding protein YcdF (DUF218 family)